MINLDRYQAVKAYLTAYFLGDTRIKPEGLLWGESKRVLEAQKSKIKYPYVWIEDIRYNLLGDRTTGLYVYWDIALSCKGNGRRDDIREQEVYLDTCKNILEDFLLFLGDEVEEDKILFSRDQLVMTSAEVFETDDNWGWELNIRIGSRLPLACSPRHDNLASYKHVQGFQPVYSGESGTISLSIGANLYEQEWDGSLSSAQIAAIFRDLIEQGEADITTFSDEFTLYLIPNTAGETLIFDIQTGNDHEWQLIPS
ncbi:MAG: hypothetical protein AAFP92_18460 [Bacteroidota bacterium]